MSRSPSKTQHMGAILGTHGLMGQSSDVSVRQGSYQRCPEAEPRHSLRERREEDGLE